MAVIRKNIAFLAKQTAWAKTGGHCWYCGVDTSDRERGWQSSPTIDHKIPLCAGGTDDDENLVIACRGCNVEKHTRTPDEFRAKVSASYCQQLQDVIDLIEESSATSSPRVFGILAALRDALRMFATERLSFFGEHRVPGHDYQI